MTTSREGAPALPAAAWRISARSNGATSCVEAIAHGGQVSVRSSIERGPALTVSAAEWEGFLGDVRTGRLDYSRLGPGQIAGPFIVGHAGDDGVVELRIAPHDPLVVRYTRIEWDVFVSGVVQDAEFTLDWLLGVQMTPGTSAAVRSAGAPHG